MFIKQDSQSRERGGGGRSCFIQLKQMSKKSTITLENTYITFHKVPNFANESLGTLPNITVFALVFYIPDIIFKSESTQELGSTSTHTSNLLLTKSTAP